MTDLNKAIELAQKASEQLQKSHVKATTYTNDKGTVVSRKEYDDSRMSKEELLAHADHHLQEAAKAKTNNTKTDTPKAKWHKGQAEKYQRMAAEHDDARHPQIIGQAKNRDNTMPAATNSFHHDGRDYSSTGKKGKSAHDGRDVREFESLDGHRTWLDHKGNVHADSKEEADKYHKRGKYADRDEKKPKGKVRIVPNPDVHKEVDGNMTIVGEQDKSKMTWTNR